ncbi:2Fe-2S iron-sulfur cluster-binding protein [Streptosporangium algeriense]|uniref:2Fe-2S iron-sulfur cluster-binding protein n=1 Tax=Streptosporangium algeriense TaxID=1682748 RepID=A0ABW3DKE6_9ACTN
MTYRGPDGETTIDVPPGTRLMQAAIDGDVDGIIGECGGNAMCATCHVYVGASDVDVFPPMSADEDEMLTCTKAERRTTSRLSCQLPAPAHDITVELPEDQ